MEHSAPQGYVRGTGRYHQPYPSALYILCICLLLYLYLCFCTSVFVFVMTSEQEDCVGLIHISISIGLIHIHASTLLVPYTVRLGAGKALS